MTFSGHSRLTMDFLSDLQQEIKAREQKAINKRRYSRFDHHSGTMLELKISGKNGQWWKTYGFVADESFGGLGILAVTANSLAVNQLCEINMPGIGWIQGRIAWCQSLGDSLQEIGIKYNHA